MPIQIGSQLKSQYQLLKEVQYWKNKAKEFEDRCKGAQMDMQLIEKDGKIKQLELQMIIGKQKLNLLIQQGRRKQIESQHLIKQNKLIVLLQMKQKQLHKLSCQMEMLQNQLTNAKIKQSLLLKQLDNKAQKIKDFQKGLSQEKVLFDKNNVNKAICHKDMEPAISKSNGEKYQKIRCYIAGSANAIRQINDKYRKSNYFHVPKRCQIFDFCLQLIKLTSVQ